jgi:hypothetical protein
MTENNVSSADYYDLVGPGKAIDAIPRIVDEDYTKFSLEKGQTIVTIGSSVTGISVSVYP